MGKELSYRDDLESLGYMMIYFLTGSLPWSDIYCETLKRTFFEAGMIKKRTRMAELCKDCPTEFFAYMQHCRDLDFEQKPDYEFLKVLIQGLANRLMIDLNVRAFDWCLSFTQPKRPVAIASCNGQT